MPELAHEDLLFTIAEVAAAFVGFSMIVGLLSGDPSDRHRFYSARDVAEVGLTTLGAALLPMAVYAFGLAPEAEWRVSSAIFAFGWVIGAFGGIGRVLRSGAIRESPAFLMSGPVFSVVGIVLLCWNVWMPGPLAPARYVLGLLLLLAFAGLSFIAATFHGRERGGVRAGAVVPPTVRARRLHLRASGSGTARSRRGAPPAGRRPLRTDSSHAPSSPARAFWPTMESMQASGTDGARSGTASRRAVRGV